MLLALAAPAAGVLAAAPAGAVGSTTCSGDSGSATFSPGLTTSPAKVQNIVAKGTLSGCSGGGVTAAATLVHLKTSTPATCASLATPGGTASGTIILKWTPKSTGTSMGTVTLTGTGGTTASVSGSVTKGLFAGSSISTTVNFTPVFTGKGAPCSKTNPLKKVTFTGTSPFMIS